MSNKINLDQLLPSKLVNDNLARFGSDNDGGYVFPEEIYRNAKQLISLGIKDDWKFELDFVNSRLVNSDEGNKVKAYDLVVDELYFLKCFIGFSFKFKFLKAISNLALIFKFISFFRNNPNVKYFKKGVSGDKFDFLKFSDILKEDDVNDSLLLSIDIEGDEYSIIDDIIDFKDKIHAFVIEFHDLDKVPTKFNNVIKKLNNDFTIVHLHLNNNSNLLCDGISSVVEITFVNKIFLTKELNYYQTPTNLDRPCNRKLADFIFSLHRND
jgi:hypothetical protein